MLKKVLHLLYQDLTIVWSVINKLRGLWGWGVQLNGTEEYFPQMFSQLSFCFGKTNSGKTSIKYICSITWNQILKELSIANIEKYNRDPYWINNTKINSFKVILKKHFLESY